MPLRLTPHGIRTVWLTGHPMAKKYCLLRAVKAARNRFNQFYTIAATGGAAEKLPFAYAEFGSYSPDGKQMALVVVSQVFRNWKRYRGGMKANIHIYNFANNSSQNISANEMQEMNFRCGMAMIFIFYLTAEPNYE